MKKLFANIVKYFKVYLIVFLISVAIGLGIFLTFYFVQNQTLVGAINGTGVSFISLFGIATLIWIGNHGAFDSMSYGFKQMFTSMFNKSANKYNDFATYKEETNEKRKQSPKFYFVMLFVSILFLIAFGVLEIVKFSIYQV